MHKLSPTDVSNNVDHPYFLVTLHGASTYLKHYPFGKEHLRLCLPFFRELYCCSSWNYSSPSFNFVVSTSMAVFLRESAPLASFDGFRDIILAQPKPAIGLQYPCGDCLIYDMTRGKSIRILP